jgi:hypothetical protein
MLQNSIACFQELHLPLLLFGVSVLFCRNDGWVLICYFKPLGGAFLRGAFQNVDTMTLALIV